MSVANLTRYEDYPCITPDGRAIRNYMATYEGRFVKFEEAMEASSKSQQKIKAEIASLVDSFDYKSIIDCSGDLINLLKRLRQLSTIK
jgi:hypothetical protein